MTFSHHSGAAQLHVLRQDGVFRGGQTTRAEGQIRRLFQLSEADATLLPLQKTHGLRTAPRYWWVARMIAIVDDDDDDGGDD